MNTIDQAPLVDTDRDELRARIADMRRRFMSLARTANPQARRPGLEWSVHQVIAHVVCVARRYQAVTEGHAYRRADRPRDLDVINDEEMIAAMAPVPELLDELEALAPVMDTFFDGLGDDSSFVFHGGATVSGVVAQVNWLFELALHGEDIARATGAPWKIDERDMVLLLREALEVAPNYLRDDVSDSINIVVALKITKARDFVMHVHGGAVDVRPRRSTDRPDAVLKAPASTMLRLLLQRIGPITAARQGLLIVGGRRPWKALKLQSLFEVA